MAHILTEEEKKEAQVILDDINIIIASFKDIPGKLKSLTIIEAWEEGVEEMIGKFRTIKAELLVAMDVV